MSAICEAFFQPLSGLWFVCGTGPVAFRHRLISGSPPG